MEAAGLAMLALVILLMIASGLPAFIVLIGVSVVFAAFGVCSGAFSYSLLTALPARLSGLLETDLLQALPLYVLMGALLDHLPLADILFRAGARVFSGTPAAPLLSAIGVGAMLAPMNGSVGASAATLSRVIHPRLISRGTSAERSLSIVCVVSTLGVVVPPSLVLILLGDTMLRAHTEAINATGVRARVINTQDVFQGALIPAGLFLITCIALAWWLGRRAVADAAPPGRPLGPGEWVVAILAPLFIVGLLASVVTGYMYAVEAAATGALVLALSGLATRTLRGEVLATVLRDTMAVTGALFAIFVAATTFTLVFRAFGSDRLLAVAVAQLSGSPTGTAVAVLAFIGACALVLDAFEIILVVVPVVMPPVLMQIPDPVWMAVLTLLVLQASFLVPPFGYAVMMARTRIAQRLDLHLVVRALAPFVCAQLLVLAAVIAMPQLTRLAKPGATAPAPLSDEEVRRRLDAIPGINPQ
ncbi:MAG TPA: TRAP transporter large permease subunit [Stellaceae bacterium]|nr:TRAP transporter large permease subunit [Stellaceae bacterium]